jgi:DNA-binding transcriptional MerR regulator
MPEPHLADRLLSITELAAELGTTPRAIRFYESKGLLDPQRAGGNRVYTYRDRARLLLILRGKRLGFSLAEVKEYLDLYDSDRSKKEQMVHLLRGARQRIAELEEQRRDLELTIEELRDVEQQCMDAMARHGIAVESASASAAHSATNGHAETPIAKPSRSPR